MQKFLHKVKEKTVNIYLKLLNTLIKPVVLCAYECLGNHSRKNTYKKVKKVLISICTQILGETKIKTK